MKITFNKQQPEFTPVQMVVDIETLEDAKVWYAIFNHGRNNRLLGKNDYADKLEDVVGENCYVGHGEVIANGVTYSEFYGG